MACRSGALSLRLAVVMGVVALGSSAWAAEFVTPLFGGSGGTSSYNLACGPGAVIVGVVSKASMFVDAIGLICQRVNANGSLGEEFTRGPVGGNGGDPRTSRCNQGNVVQGVQVNAGWVIDDGGFYCSSWDTMRKRPVFSTSGRCIGDRCTTGFKGGYPLLSSPKGDSFFCPEGKVGKAIRGKYGIYVDSLRFVCDDWNR